MNMTVRLGDVLTFFLFLIHMNRSSNKVNSGEYFPPTCPTQWGSITFIIHFHHNSNARFQCLDDEIQ